MIREIRLYIDAENETNKIAQHFSFCVTPLGDPAAAQADAAMHEAVDSAASLGKSFIVSNVLNESPVKG